MLDYEKLQVTSIMVKNEIRKAGGKVSAFKTKEIIKAAKALLKTREGAAFIKKVEDAMNKRY